MVLAKTVPVKNVAPRVALLGIGVALALLGWLSTAPESVPAAPGDLSGTGVRVVSESAGGLTLHITFAEPVRTLLDPPEGGSFLLVTVPGVLAGESGEPGEPALPVRGFPFGLPDGAEARVASVRILRSSSFQGPPPAPVPRRRWRPDEPPALEETYETDATVYAGGTYPPRRVALGPVMGWRHQRVQSVEVHPVQVDPATGSYSAIREMEVEIRFEAGRPGERAGRRIPAGRDAPGWDEMIEKVLLNPTSSRAFRTRSDPEPLEPLVQFGGTNLRIRLGGSGVCRLTYDDLAARGWPAGVALADVAVEERGYDKSLSDPFTVTGIPRRMEDTNGNGVFDSGDFVLFYGFNYEDRFYNHSQDRRVPFADGRFSYFHTYWLSHAPGAGVDMQGVLPVPAGPFTEVDSFPSTVWGEENLLYVNNPSGSTGGGSFPLNENIFWYPPSYSNEASYFTANDPAPGGVVRVRARWQGNDNVAQSFEHFVSLDLNGTTLIDQEYLRYRDVFVSPVQTMPQAGILNAGQNQVTVRGYSNGLPNRTGAYFDWYEIVYDRLLVARGDQLSFNSAGLTGDLEFAVQGFSAPDILVLDITNPVDTRIVAGQVEDAGGSYTFRFQVNVPSGTRRYHAVVPGAVQGLPPSRHPIPPDLGSDPIGIGLQRDLLAEGAGSDFILISHSMLGSAWDPLVAHRESQGHRVFTCDIWEVYDQFAGGDKTPWAIQRFLAQAFRRWDPSPTYVLLGADASEDYRNDTSTSDPDWLPTQMLFSGVPGVAGLELSGSDEWYVAFLAEGDPEYDVIPDMIIARIPAGTTAEVADVVNKTIAYETMDPGDDWRQRGFLLADDQYSTGIYTSELQYCWKPGEAVFKSTSLEVCNSIAELGHLPEFDCITYFLADHLDTVATLYRNPGDGDCPVKPGGGGVLTETRSYVRANLTRQVLDELKRGHLVWEYTGHGNKNLMMSESLIDNRPGTSTVDIRRIDNVGKPHIFLGYACHLVEFEYYQERTRGQSIGEELLFSPNKGAVGVMASTGYEWLHTNPPAQRVTSEALFWDLPRDPDTGRPRRIFGEAMTRALVGLALSGGGTNTDFREMLRTYQIFGDPALVIDIRPAAFQVEVDGEPHEDGIPLLADSFTDSLTVTAVVSDDVDLSSIRVRDGDRELTEVQITPPDPAEGGAQFYEATFRTALRLEGSPGVNGTGAITHTYEVALEAVDWVGRGSRFSFPVRFQARFLALDPGGQRILLYEPGLTDPAETANLMDPDTPLRVEVESAVSLPPSGLELAVDGIPLAAEPQPQDETGRVWVLEGHRSWFDGPHTVELRLSSGGAGPDLVSTLFFKTNNEDSELLNMDAYGRRGVVFYPNPAEGAEGSLLYQLNRAAERAEVTAYTVQGRKILTADAPTQPGVNAFRWDLRDQVGDPVGNGVYLFLLRLWDAGGKVITTDPQRVVVSR